MQRLVFNFQGIKVFVESDWSALLSVIEKDFWSFRDESFDINSKVNQADVALKIILGPAPYDLTAKKVYLKTVSASVIDEEDFRYCDYGEGVVVRGDLKLETYEIHGVDFERVHEVTYLVLLSRVGKKLDIKGIHKLHAFAIFVQ